MKNLDIENYNPKEIGRDRELHTISNFTDLSVAELLDKLYYSGTNYISYVDCYNHIKINTDNFDDFLMANLNLDIVNFIKEIINLSAYSIDFPLANDIMNEIAALIFEDVIDYDTGLANLMEYVSAFNSIVKHKKINLIDSSKDLETRPYIRKMKHMKFDELFQKEYNKKEYKDKFFNYVKGTYFDENMELKQGFTISDIARIYHLLQKKEIIYSNNASNGLIAFVKEFGYTAHKTNLPKDKDKKDITVRTLTAADDFEVLQHKNKILSIFGIKTQEY